MVVEKKFVGEGKDGVTILFIEGLINLGQSAEFFMNALGNIKAKKIVIDFKKIDYIDSTGIGELVGMIKANLTKKDKEVVLSNVSSRVLRLLKLAESPFRIFDTETLAEEYLTNH